MTKLQASNSIVEITEEESLRKDLDEARLQITVLKSQVDDTAGTVNLLDKEVAKLKDEKGKLEQQNQNMFNSFQELYNTYLQLYEQVANTQTALTITGGKLAESLIKYKFTIPQQEKQ